MGGASNLRLRIILHSISLPKKWQPSLELGISSSFHNISVAVYHHACLVANLRKGKIYLCFGKHQVDGECHWFPLSYSTHLYCLLPLCRHLIVSPCALWEILGF